MILLPQPCNVYVRNIIIGLRPVAAADEGKGKNEKHYYYGLFVRQKIRLNLNTKGVENMDVSSQTF